MSIASAIYPTRNETKVRLIGLLLLSTVHVNSQCHVGTVSFPSERFPENALLNQYSMHILSLVIDHCSTLINDRRAEENIFENKDVEKTSFRGNRTRELPNARLPTELTRPAT